MDPGSFQEIDPYVTHRHSDFGLDKKRFPGDSVVTGLGRINGQKVAVAAQDFTVVGGSFSEVQAQKVCKVLDLALEAGLPFVSLNDSVGARIQEGVWSLAGYSELFWRNTQASGVIPQISVMLGPCAGGSVYSPGLTDFIVMTEGISHMFITGPEVIKTVLGEDISMEELGGAKVHSEITGNAHFFAESEDECFDQIKSLLSYLPWSNTAIENGYQLLGFAGSALTVWLGIRRHWPGVVNLGSTFFVLYLYTKLFDWFWDWMPKYLFFLLLGLVAVLLLVVMRRFRARTGEAVA